MHGGLNAQHANRRNPRKVTLKWRETLNCGKECTGIIVHIYEWNPRKITRKTTGHETTKLAAATTTILAKVVWTLGSFYGNVHSYHYPSVLPLPLLSVVRIHNILLAYDNPSIEKGWGVGCGGGGGNDPIGCLLKEGNEMKLHFFFLQATNTVLQVQVGYFAVSARYKQTQWTSGR